MSDDTLQTATYPGDVGPEVSQMIEAGVFYGLRKTKTHPDMKQYVLMNRGGVEIINLQKTAEAIDAAAAFLSEVVRRGGFALFVATQPAAEGKVLEIAKKFNFPYVTTRWPGGAITNFKVISGRIEYFKKLRSDLAAGAFSHYTKKERLMLERELNRLQELFGGLETMTKLPDVLVVIDPVMHHTAVREANRAKIPIVAFANVDASPKEVSYLVPGNDNARRSIEWFLGKVEKAIEDGLAQREAKAQEVPDESKNK